MYWFGRKRETRWLVALLLFLLGSAAAVQKGLAAGGGNPQQVARLFAEAAQEVNRGQYVAAIEKLGSWPDISMLIELLISPFQTIAEKPRREWTGSPC